MTSISPRISALGQRALIVEFGDVISTEINDLAILLSEYLDAHPFPGYVESAPAYSSTYVGFDPRLVTANRGQAKTTFDLIAAHVTNALAEIECEKNPVSKIHKIPVSFGAESGPDLNYVADNSGLLSSEVIEIFTSITYRVFMLGFLPGFAYLGEVDERVAVPRRATPRQRVAVGSVGIAGRQTGIYPLESPGGWQLIGRTDVGLFVPSSMPPCLFGPGDHVKFVAV
jgi:inhibitor of KinA